MVMGFRCHFGFQLSFFFINCFLLDLLAQKWFPPAPGMQDSNYWDPPSPPAHAPPLQTQLGSKWPGRHFFWGLLQPTVLAPLPSEDPPPPCLGPCLERLLQPGAVGPRPSPGPLRLCPLAHARDLRAQCQPVPPPSPEPAPAPPGYGPPAPLPAPLGPIPCHTPPGPLDLRPDPPDPPAQPADVHQHPGLLAPWDQGRSPSGLAPGQAAAAAATLPPSAGPHPPVSRLPCHRAPRPSHAS